MRLNNPIEKKQAAEILETISKMEAKLSDMRREIESRSGLSDCPDVKCRNVVVAVAKAFGVSQECILGRSKDRESCEARFAVWRIMRAKMGMSLKSIATRFGRHHSTISHGLNITSNLCLTNPDYRGRISIVMGAA